MKIQRICESYREQRGDFEVNLDIGESVSIRTSEGIIKITPSVSNCVNVMAVKSFPVLSNSKNRELEVKNE